MTTDRTHADLVAHAATLFPNSSHTTTTQQEWKASIYAQFKTLWGALPIVERLGNAYRAAAQGACLTREPHRSWWEEMADVDLPALQEEWERRGLLV